MTLTDYNLQPLHSIMLLCCKGELADDVPHGFGVFCYSSGDRYEGQVFRGKFHGKGRYTTSGGTIMDSEWVDGVREVTG